MEVLRIWLANKKIDNKLSKGFLLSQYTVSDFFHTIRNGRVGARCDSDNENLLIISIPTSDVSSIVGSFIFFWEALVFQQASELFQGCQR